MHRLQSLLSIALLISTVLAAPAPQKLQKRSFKINRIKQHNFVADGPKALAKAYAKYGMSMPSTGNDMLDFLPKTSLVLSPASSKATNGTGGAGSENGQVSATGTQNDAEFLSPVSVGGQTLIMDFDSGSSDMYVNIFLSRSLC